MVPRIPVTRYRPSAPYARRRSSSARGDSGYSGTQGGGTPLYLWLWVPWPQVKSAFDFALQHLLPTTGPRPVGWGHLVYGGRRGREASVDEIVGFAGGG